jgi:membrane protein required for colicin V production
MTWVDLAVFGAWVGSVAAAIFALPRMRGTVRGWLPSPEWVDPVSFIIVFLVSLIVLTLIARTVGGLVRNSALSGVDRTLGLVFGLARGAAVVIIAYIIGQMVFPIERWPDAVLDARTLSPTYEAARWVREQLPEPYRPHALEPPPAARHPTAEALLRASPQGLATGRPTGKPPERE